MTPGEFLWRVENHLPELASEQLETVWKCLMVVSWSRAGHEQLNVAVAKIKEDEGPHDYSS